MPGKESAGDPAGGGAELRSGATSGLLTDLYQLTMLDAYIAADMHDEAVFEFFVRRLPEQRNFLLAAGLDQLLDFLERLAFTPAELDWLASTGKFSPALPDYLERFRFRGEVRAMPEGSVFFADEPIVQIIASLPEAQLIETRLINLIQLQTMIASKAARSVLAAPDKLLVGFGLRRAHGAEAGLLGARAEYIAGFSGTSNVLANMTFGVPMYGTMAHSFVQAHASEIEAFEHFARTYPDNTVLLIDTYDTLAAARDVAELAGRLRPEGIRIGAVRLDSGDLADLAVRVRRILDEGGCEDVGIFASGSLDEHLLARQFTGLPIDGFGIGTRLDVSADAPYLDCAYKLEEYAGIARRKRSSGKSTWPGRKQVYRRFDNNGRMMRDVIALDDETLDGVPLLEIVMRDGRRIEPATPLEALRARAAKSLKSLPDPLRDLFAKQPYPVEISAAIRALAAELDGTT